MSSSIVFLNSNNPLIYFLSLYSGFGLGVFLAIGWYILAFFITNGKYCKTISKDGNKKSKATPRRPLGKKFQIASLLVIVSVALLTGLIFNWDFHQILFYLLLSSSLVFLFWLAFQLDLPDQVGRIIVIVMSLGFLSIAFYERLEITSNAVIQHSFNFKQGINNSTFNIQKDTQFIIFCQPSRPGGSHQIRPPRVCGSYLKDSSGHTFYVTSLKDMPKIDEIHQTIIHTLGFMCSGPYLLSDQKFYFEVSCIK